MFCDWWILRTCSRSRSPWRTCSSCSNSGKKRGDSAASVGWDSASVRQRQETEWARGSAAAFHPLLTWREHRGAPWGKHIHLKFNLLNVIGLIHSFNWTYHPRFHWHFLICRNWSVIAPCLLQLWHLLMNYAHLGPTCSHPDKTFITHEQMKWV